MAKRTWYPGDPALDFALRSTNSPRFHFNTAAGRYIVICFYGSASNDEIRKSIEHMTARTDFFNDDRGAFFGVSIDPEDESQGRVQQKLPGIRFFWDFERTVSELYGALEKDTATEELSSSYHRFTLVLDPMLRVLAYIPLSNIEQHNKAFDYVLSQLPDIAAHAGVPLHAPVLILPRVFEPGFCKRLIELYEAQGGTESGFMRQVGDKTVGILDNNFKRRKDFSFDEEAEFEELRVAVRARINQRLIPEIYKAFQFKATRMERYIVACYDSDSGGFFRPHRDNTTPGTAHRRFACTLNLNAEEYEGGNLRFPEFGQKTYRAPTGGAVVFSCSVLHEATPVTKGKRYAFLPFLYDDAAAEIRRQNAHGVSGELIDKNKGESEYITEGFSPSAHGES